MKKKLSWKTLAKQAWAKLKKERPDKVDEVSRVNYVGGGGVVFPNGTLHLSYDEDDVGYETLYFECQHFLNLEDEG